MGSGQYQGRVFSSELGLERILLMRFGSVIMDTLTRVIVTEGAIIVIVGGTIGCESNAIRQKVIPAMKVTNPIILHLRLPFRGDGVS